MNEKQTNVVRLGLKALTAAACVFALIGSIGLLASIVKLTKYLSVAGTGSSSRYPNSLSTLPTATNLYTYLDLARFGAFAVFLILLFYAAIELITHSRKKTLSIIMAASSVLGFVGCFLTSMTAMYNSAISSFSQIIGYGYSSSNSDKLMSQIINKMFTPMTVGGIFILISSAAVIIFLTAELIKAKMATNTYGGGPQAYPNQQYPNQQYPNQQYPGQPYQGQVPPQNPNDFTPQ